MLAPFPGISSFSSRELAFCFSFHKRGKGLLKYDKRKGWRGPLINKKNIIDWDKDLKKFYLENFDFLVALP